MFNDSHETTRHVGFMTVILAIGLLIGLYGLGAAFLTGLDILKGSDVPSKAMLEQLDKDAGKVRESLVKEEALKEKWTGYQQVRTQVETLEGERTRMEERIAEIQKQVEDARQELRGASDEFEAYRDRYRDVERTRAKGEVVDLSDLKGEGFEKCQILGISPLRMRVMTPTGPVGIDYQELPPKLQDRFQFDEAEAGDYRQWLKEVDQKNAERMAVFREKQKLRKAKEAAEFRKNRIFELKVEIQILENLIAQLEVNAKRHDQDSARYLKEAQSARAAGRVTSKFGLSSQMKRKADGVRRRIKGVEGQIDGKKLELAKLESKDRQ